MARKRASRRNNDTIETKDIDVVAIDADVDVVAIDVDVEKVVDPNEDTSITEEDENTPSPTVVGVLSEPVVYNKHQDYTHNIELVKKPSVLASANGKVGMAATNFVICNKSDRDVDIVLIADTPIALSVNRPKTLVPDQECTCTVVVPEESITESKTVQVRVLRCQDSKPLLAIPLYLNFKS